MRQLDLTTSNVPESIWGILRTNRTGVHVHVFAKRNNAVTSSAASNLEPVVVNSLTLRTKDWLYGVVRSGHELGKAVGCPLILLPACFVWKLAFQVNMIKVDDVPKDAHDRYLWMDLLPLLPAKLSEPLRQLDTTGDLCSSFAIVVAFCADALTALWLCPSAPEHAKLPTGSQLTFWKPELAIRVVQDETHYPGSLV